MKHRDSLLIAAVAFSMNAACSWGQVSELYMITSPNVIYPVGNTMVYQGGTQVRQWTHARSYELPIAVVGGMARQNANQSGLQGTGYSLAGTPTGNIYPAAPGVFDAASDGSSIFGWDISSATLKRYDLDWQPKQNLFTLGSSYAYAYMGITYDLKTSSVWLTAWSTGSIDTRGYLYNYSLTGQLLGAIALANPQSTGCGLAYDPADDTFWMFNWRDQRYEQYSRAGEMVSSLNGMTRIYGAEFAIPEPSFSVLLGVGIFAWACKNRGDRRTGKSTAAQR